MAPLSEARPALTSSSGNGNKIRDSVAQIGRPTDLTNL
jgi:hypothetical protein